MSTSATLTLSQLTELRKIAEGGRSTQYKPEVISFANSGEIYRDEMENPHFSGKKIDSVFNSLNRNLQELKRDNPTWPEIVVKKEGDKVLLINMTALQGALTETEA